MSKAWKSHFATLEKLQGRLETMKVKSIPKVMFVAALMAATVLTQALAQTQTEPLGGQPAAGSKPSVDDLAAQVAYQRTFEAVVWAAPAVAIYRMRAGAFSALGAEDNAIFACSLPATPKMELLTANNAVPYIGSVTMYDGKSQLLIQNPINRYLINSPMLPRMKKNADGSLTLYIQKDSPGVDKEANWLPAPNDLIYLVMRLYWPKTEAPSILPPGEGTWNPPGIVQVK